MSPRVDTTPLLGVFTSKLTPLLSVEAFVFITSSFSILPFIIASVLLSLSSGEVGGDLASGEVALSLVVSVVLLVVASSVVGVVLVVASSVVVPSFLVVVLVVMVALDLLTEVTISTFFDGLICSILG